MLKPGGRPRAPDRATRLLRGVRCVPLQLRTSCSLSIRAASTVYVSRKPNFFALEQRIVPALKPGFFALEQTAGECQPVKLKMDSHDDPMSRSHLVPRCVRPLRRLL